MELLHKRFIGYVRSNLPDKELAHEACGIQKYRIKCFCREAAIEYVDIIEDYGYKDDCRKKEKGLATELGVPELKDKYIPEGWGKILGTIVHNEIDVIIVDTKMRLAINERYATIINRLCNENGVTIMEIPAINAPENPEDRIYLYHCTNNPAKRCGVVINDIDEMYIYATSLKGGVAGLFVDTEFRDRIQLENAINACGQGTLVVKNYLHLKRFTGASFAVFKQIEESGGRIISQEEGYLRSLDKETINKLKLSQIRVAFYDSHLHKYDLDNKELEIQKVKAYIRCNTSGWILDTDDIYVDEYGFKKQRRLEELISKQDMYGLIIIDSYPRLSKDISRFMKIVKRIHIPIYSMKEEF